MNTKGYAVILIAAVLVIVGAIAVIIMTDSTPEKISKEDHEYDPSKGWGSWDPLLTNTSSSNMTGSAYIAQVADYWYSTIYGEDMDYSKYSISDVPDDFLPYQKLVKDNGNGTFTVTKMIRNDGETVYTPKEITIKNLPDYFICAASFTSTVYTVLCAAHGVDYKDCDPAVIKELYSKIYAGDSGFIKYLDTQYGIPVTEDKTSIKMGSCTSIMKYKEQYMSVFGDIKDAGKTVCFMGMGTIGSEADDWLTEQMSVFNSYSVTFDVTDMPAILGNIEVVAYLLGYGDKAQEIVDYVRLHLYACGQEAQKQESKYDYTRTALYINVGENKARGLNTLANDLYELFGFKNCVTHTGNQEVKEEVILKAQPDIIIFVSDLKPTDPDFDLKSALRVKDN
ncbi:MAG: hypothetical protein MJZ68_00895 [archaeon]|nr:hypothetical protein [archaeon]